MGRAFSKHKNPQGRWGEEGKLVIREQASAIERKIPTAMGTGEVAHWLQLLAAAAEEHVPFPNNQHHPPQQSDTLAPWNPLSSLGACRWKNQGRAGSER